MDNDTTPLGVVLCAASGGVFSVGVRPAVIGKVVSGGSDQVIFRLLARTALLFCTCVFRRFHSLPQFFQSLFLNAGYIAHPLL